MPGWRRNRKDAAPSVGPASQPAARPRDDWRTLPPLPTVLRAPVTTVATGAFGDSLSTWRDPSFLSPLGHQIDPDGPAGLVTGLARVLARPEPLTYYHDRPLPLARGGPPSLQRTVASWRPPPPARSLLTTAPDVDLTPVPRHVVSLEPRPASTNPVTATDQEPEPPGIQAEPPGIQAEPSAIPGASGEDSGTPASAPTDAGEAAASVPTSRVGRWEASPHVEQPLVADRSVGNVMAQRQMAPISPQMPTRRLGLGAPLSHPPSNSPVRAVPVPEQPVVARSAGWSAQPDPGGDTPRRPVAPEPGNGPGQEWPAAVSGDPAAVSGDPAAVSAGWPAGSAAAPEPAPAAGGSVQRVLADRAGSDDPGLPGPGSAGAAAPAGKPLTEAPLIGEVPSASHALRPPITRPTTAAAPPPAPPTGRTTPRAGSTPSFSTQAPLAATAPALPSAARTPVQRSVTSPGTSPGNLQVRLPTSASVSRPPNDAEPTSAFPPPGPRPDDQPAGPPDRPPVPAQRLPSGSSGAVVLPRHVAVAPLLGHRQPGRMLDTPSGAGTGPQLARVSGAPDAAARDLVCRNPVRGAVAAPEAVAAQRSVQAPALVSRLDGQAAGAVRGPVAGYRESAARYVDAGAIAVAKGLARRDPDGSVVFDLGLAPVPADPFPPPRYDEPAGRPAADPVETVQRQEVAAGSVDVPAPSDSGLPMASTPASVPSATSVPASSAPGPVGPPLDELARQLFGPLTAWLKAELRLDRERAGLLTDLWQ